jgi:hypothetical protein
MTPPAVDQAWFGDENPDFCRYARRFITSSTAGFNGKMLGHAGFVETCNLVINHAGDILGH